MLGKYNLSKVSWVLVLVGAVNWGLVGVGGLLGQNWNVVNLVLGSWQWLELLVYVLVGVAGVLLAVSCKDCKP